MIFQTQIKLENLSKEIKVNRLQYGGNIKLKIFGLLTCKSGKRMNKCNRVFFSSRDEAIQSGFRPCGHCINIEYKIWKEKSLI